MAWGYRLIEPGQTWGRGLVTLVGDAAHPTTPALGQGGCMALEVGILWQTKPVHLQTRPVPDRRRILA